MFKTGSSFWFLFYLCLLLYTCVVLSAAESALTGVWYRPSCTGRIIASPAADLVAVTQGFNTIGIYCVSDGSPVSQMTVPAIVMRAFAFSADGKLLATGTDDQMIRLWRVDNGTLVRTLSAHAGVVTSFAFSPDGKWMASGNAAPSITLWKCRDWSVAETITGMVGSADSLLFSPDTRYLASESASWDDPGRFRRRSCF